MVSDSDLVGRLREFLSTSDLDTTTAAIVRRQLEEDFGVDLSDKKAFIREQIDLYFQSINENEQGDGEGEGEGEEDQEFGAEDGKIKSEEAAEEEEEEVDEQEESEEAASNKSAAKRGSKKPIKEVKRRGGGFTKLCNLSPRLQKFTGVPQLARTEVVKQLWSYIRENNLQDPSNRRNIICDETLHDLFAVKSINMFQMNKALAKHIWPLDSDGAAVTSVQKEKSRKQARDEDSDEPKRKEKRRKGGNSDSDEPKRKEKRRKGGNSGFLAPLPLSDALVKFIGTGESALSRAGVVKRIWEYIKTNNLQDPSDKRIIICDAKLKELFDVDTFHGFTVPKLLTTHFVKTEQ